MAQLVSRLMNQNEPARLGSLDQRAQKPGSARLDSLEAHEPLWGEPSWLMNLKLFLALEGESKSTRAKTRNTMQKRESEEHNT